MWLASVTKVSKKRQVCRAISRSAEASAFVTARLPASAGDRLTQWATAGASSHATTKGTATGAAAAPACPTKSDASAAMTTLPAI